MIHPAGYRVLQVGILHLFPLWLLVNLTYAQFRYSIPEELNRGEIVGNIAKDLGTDVAKLVAANLQVLSDSDSQYFSVNVNNGAILVNDRIDRELLCGQSVTCILNLKFAIENPVEVYRIEVEILDINDNSPRFQSEDLTLKINELASPGARFLIPNAQDPDIGSNALQEYLLSSSENFALIVKKRTDGSKFPELVLEKALDREQTAVHHLVLKAEDGGVPCRSSTMQITIIVLDANDNHPAFDQPSYNVQLKENAPKNSLVIKLNATDLDEGPNGEIEYFFSSHNSEALSNIFQLNSESGEIRVLGNLDFEEISVYEIDIEARDKGSPIMEEHCSVIVHIIDVNDNTPEMTISAFSSSVPEDSPAGTVVAVITIKDKDHGDNGKVQCQVDKNLPFTVREDFEQQFSLITSDNLDRESVSEYHITITAKDMGNPPLSTVKVISVGVSDVNDNTPQFVEPVYEVFVEENNKAGELLCTVSATDPDLDQNSRLSYSILQNPKEDYTSSSHIYINSENGQVYLKFPLDYERINYFQFQIEVSDAGSPPLKNKTVVHVFVLDQNDNYPAVVFPLVGANSVAQCKIPRSTGPNVMVSKISAVDHDSGRNAWLSYNLLEATDPTLFSIVMRTGEIKTKRAIQDVDPNLHELLLLVKDSGEPCLSTSVTVMMTLEDKDLEVSQGVKDHSKKRNISSLTLYLIVCLIVISVISLIGLAALGIKIHKCENKNFPLCCRQSQKKGVVTGSKLHGTFQLHPSLCNTIIGVRVDCAGNIPSNRRVRTCFSPVSDISEFMFMRPPHVTASSSSPGILVPDPNFSIASNEQAQANMDWHFSQAQRPGTSGAQPAEDVGVWPNNPVETERLQAMILASATEAAESSNIGGGTGTMGLGACYGPQFTLQHVPDYRQNIYIPGTATLNAAVKQEGKVPAPSGGNKKKAAKKEKK